MANINEECIDQPYILWESDPGRFNRRGESLFEKPRDILCWKEHGVEEPFDGRGKGRAIRHQVKVLETLSVHSLLLPGTISTFVPEDITGLLQIVEFREYKELGVDSYDRWAHVINYRGKVLVKAVLTLLLDSSDSAITDGSLLVEGG